MATRGHIVLLREGATAPIKRPIHTVPETTVGAPRLSAVGRVTGTPHRIPKAILKKSDPASGWRNGRFRRQHASSDAVFHGPFADSTMPAARMPEPA
jgi:hypothetical protein